MSEQNTLSGIPSSIDKSKGTHTEEKPYDGVDNKLPKVAPKPPVIPQPVIKNPV